MNTAPQTFLHPLLFIFYFSLPLPLLLHVGKRQTVCREIWRHFIACDLTVYTASHVTMYSDVYSISRPSSDATTRMYSRICLLTWTYNYDWYYSSQQQMCYNYLLIVIHFFGFVSSRWKRISFWLTFTLQTFSYVSPLAECRAFRSLKLESGLKQRAVWTCDSHHDGIRVLSWVSCQSSRIILITNDACTISKNKRKVADAFQCF